MELVNGSGTSQAGGVRERRQAAFSQARQQLIVALDVATMEQALTLAASVENQCRWFKVGLELYLASGPAVVANLAAQGYSIFLDLKLHDIPNTVASAIRSTASLGASLLTIHAAGGPAMLTAAVEAAASLESPPELLAVTVLTSIDQAQLSAIGVDRTPASQVELLARMGLAAGLRGFVSSPEEVGMLRRLAGPEAILVIPGIRPAGSSQGDQQRIAAPGTALREGASYLVIGRPITRAEDPAAAAEAILNEMADEIEKDMLEEEKIDGTA